MTNLAEIQPFVQDYAETIADVLDVDVTIVDDHCIRIGGTGLHKGKIGEPVPQGSFFRSILVSGQPGFIGDIHHEAVCQHCSLVKVCEELATMGVPVFLHRQPVGVIGIIAFTAAQQRKLVEMSAKLLSFLQHMSGLLETKLQLMAANYRLQHQVQEALQAAQQTYTFGSMLGCDPVFLRVVQKAQQVADSTSTVLIRGESGTGKELLARAIHSASSRHDQPFIVVNCPSIPESLLESELFGYVGGAFTGANKLGKLGKFELAHGGTIFLDEIGDLPLSVQPKLLRVIQERIVDRVGGVQPVAVDVRVIAATNKDLEQMVATGSFRDDLYYRLNVIPLFIAPLRERPDDIVLYLDHFLHKFGEQLAKPGLRLAPQLQRWLQGFAWPGNVRQLANVVEYLVNMAKTAEVGFQDMPYNLAPHENIPAYAAGLSLGEQLADLERQLLRQYVPPGAPLAKKVQVAQELKISLATLYRKLDKYGLE